MITGIDPRVDYAFKRVFGSESTKDLLIDLLNAVLDPPPERRVASVELLDPFNQKQFDEDKLSIVDLKAVDQSGRRFTVEMQMVVLAGLRKRLLYYWARLYSEQLTEKTPYHALQPAIIIAFVSGRLFPERPEYHLEFSLRSQDAQVVFSDDLSLHTIELGKFGLSPDSLRTPLDRWAFFLRNGERLDPEKLPPVLDSAPAIRRAVGELKMIAQTDEEKYQYDRRMRQWRDEAEREHEMREAAEAGEAKGEIRGTIKTLQEVLRLPVSTRDELSRCTPAELETLLSNLRDQFNRQQK